MIKTILVPVTGFASDEAALETAYLAARLFNAHIDGLHAKPQWTQVAATMITEDVAGAVADEFFAAFEQETKAFSWRAHRHFAEFLRRRSVAVADTPPAGEYISAALREVSGAVDETAIANGRVHDLIVLGRGPQAGGSYDIDPGAVVLGAGRPVLLAPGQAPENLGPTTAIAWKNTAESARAITAAMPLLLKAGRIMILAADEGKGEAETMDSAQAAALQLRWHGCTVEARFVAPGKRPAAEAVFDAAQNAGASLVVMGAYGRARLREFIFGGFTRDVLRDCPLPVLLFH